MLFGRRGVYRWRNDFSSSPLRMPSIHPQHSMTSSASATVTDGRPEPRLCSFTHSSVARAWCAFIQASSAARSRKVLILVGCKDAIRPDHTDPAATEPYLPDL